MRIFIQTIGSGKQVAVVDRLQHKEVFHRYLELTEGAVPVDIASPNGETGNIDILKGDDDPPDVYSKTDYDAKKDEVIQISDGQD